MKNYELFKNEMQYDQELKERTLIAKGCKISIFYMDGMVDDAILSDFVTKSLLTIKKTPNSYQDLIDNTIANTSLSIEHKLSDACDKYFLGYAILFIHNASALSNNNSSQCENDSKNNNNSSSHNNESALSFIPFSALSIDTQKIQSRNIVEPPTSSVIKGPREGFIESYKINLSLIRKRLKSKSFHVDILKVGKHTQTTVCVCYMKGIARQSIVKEIKRLVSSIEIDGILDSSYIAKFIDNRHSTLFKMVGSCEKPDIITGKLLEGRVAIVVDGSPIVLTVPYLFIEDLQAPDDYYDAPEIATFIRIIRFISVVGSILIPAIYVSLQLYNYQIIPLKFLITIINSTKDIPLSPVAEMIVVLVLFDLLRESNMRMPRFAGLSLSVVGAIVLGDAAVKAGLLGAPAVVIGAISGIGLYAMPDNTVLFTLLRLAFTIIGGIAGLFGIMIITLFILSYMVSLHSFNAPYFAPFAPIIPHDRQDAIIKKPLLKLQERPYSFDLKNHTRTKTNTHERKN